MPQVLSPGYTPYIRNAQRGTSDIQRNKDTKSRPPRGILPLEPPPEQREVLRKKRAKSGGSVRDGLLRMIGCSKRRDKSSGFRARSSAPVSWRSQPTPVTLSTDFHARGATATYGTPREQSTEKRTYAPRKLVKTHRTTTIARTSKTNQELPAPRRYDNYAVLPHLSRTRGSHGAERQRLGVGYYGEDLPDLPPRPHLQLDPGSLSHMGASHSFNPGDLGGGDIGGGDIGGGDGLGSIVSVAGDVLLLLASCLIPR
jgi:hypothetical protein